MGAALPRRERSSPCICADPLATWGWQEACEFRIHQHVTSWTRGGAQTLPSMAGSPSGSLVPRSEGPRDMGTIGNMQKIRSC